MISREVGHEIGLLLRDLELPKLYHLDSVFPEKLTVQPRRRAA
jgi:hypothetical protein